MADDARPTCERCRRPKADPLDWTISKSQCDRNSPDSRFECDRLLLERADSAEVQVAALRTQVAEANERALDATRERDALAEAGDALAEATAGTITEALAHWGALRSPKGASDGD